MVSPQCAHSKAQNEYDVIPNRWCIVRLDGCCHHQDSHPDSFKVNMNMKKIAFWLRWSSMLIPVLIVALMAFLLACVLHLASVVGEWVSDNADRCERNLSRGAHLFCRKAHHWIWANPNDQ